MNSRSIRPGDQKHMLDVTAEQNIGNSVASLQPQAGGATVIPQTNPERILMLSGPSSAGQTTSVALTASRIVPGPNNPSPGFPGPIPGSSSSGTAGSSHEPRWTSPSGRSLGNSMLLLRPPSPRTGA